MSSPPRAAGALGLGSAPESAGSPPEHDGADGPTSPPAPRCTLHPSDQLALEGPLSRVKSLKKSLRQSFRRIRRSRASSRKRRPAGPPGEVRPGPVVPASATGSGSSTPARPHDLGSIALPLCASLSPSVNSSLCNTSGSHPRSMRPGGWRVVGDAVASPPWKGSMEQSDAPPGRKALAHPQAMPTRCRCRRGAAGQSGPACRTWSWRPCSARSRRGRQRTPSQASSGPSTSPTPT